MADIQRRTVLVGVAATVASAGTAGLFPRPLAAQSEEKSPEEKFANLSALLTGFDVGVLLPQVDPGQLNLEIFTKVNEDPNRAKTLESMFGKLAAAPAGGQEDAVRAMVSTWDKNDPLQVAMCFLGRSIILAWYLGAWYDPKALEVQTYNKPDESYAYRRYSKSVLIPHSVLSPTAYTSSLVWRVMRAHPMGYSNMQFGYWGTTPPGPDLFTAPIKVPTT